MDVADLHPTGKGPGIPAELAMHIIGQRYGQSPKAVRDWPEQDVEDELLLMAAEAAAQRKRMPEPTRGRVV